MALGESTRRLVTVVAATKRPSSTPGTTADADAGREIAAIKDTAKADADAEDNAAMVGIEQTLRAAEARAEETEEQL